MGRDTASELMFADHQRHQKDCRSKQGSAGIHKEMDGDSEGKQCAVLVCSGDKKNPVKVK